MRSSSVKAIALGGMLCAVAVVIMCLGGLIPFATFICPMLATVVCYIVLRSCGKKITWCWYIAVAILSILLAPDKEAAAVFVFLGYYPILKIGFDKHRFSWIYKIILFNCAIVVMYFLLFSVFGMAQLSEEYAQLGSIGGCIMLLLGNATFFLLDRLLSILNRKR